ncbi:hypothetical protein GCM10011586_23380 [Silvibacterium dinghuense]|nr:hypothetical protein GCM10011586_23380 [Silvibacterium dinghuense]
MLLPLSLAAEDGHAGWLRYARLSAQDAQAYASLPQIISVEGSSQVDRCAAQELAHGLSSMLGHPFAVAPTAGRNTAHAPAFDLRLASRNDAMPPESYRFKREGNDYVILGADTRGVLYGVFHLLELVATLQPLPKSTTASAPAAPIRWVNQWDNLDGSIERGYAGRSIFFDGGKVRDDLSRVSDYGRLLASIGINGLTVNNVNADLRTLEPEELAGFTRIADELRPWGIRLSLSIDLSSPEVVGHLKTFDPLDPAVAAWWSKTVDEIYTRIPDFAGFVVKADSEGRPGPSHYDRTPAEAANVLARPLQKHGGIVLYRGFVYNHHLDWHDLKADRARAGYDNFHALDGKFEPNVVLQIKHGPIDFQVREPVSPLFAAMRHTSQTVELEITQEYTGQQRHMVFLVPMWKWALDTDLRAENRSTPLKEIVEGRSFHQPLGGFVAVANVGMDTNWLHHPMAMANLYGYGRLAWNPDEPAEKIIDTWTRLTFGNKPEVVRTIDALQLESWRDYENYTGPLGIGTLTDIIGVHYGPGVGSAENNGWGQWFRADRQGVGMDRTVATGTGYIGQYPPQLAAIYESLKTCPDDLLLFMHHVPYTYRLHNGDTVIQHIYNSHYEGAAAVATYAPRWLALKPDIDPERFEKVLELFHYQAGHAIVWRDAVNTWFHTISGIPDELHRVDNFPDRMEAESMQADGYRTVAVTPIETASGGHAVECEQGSGCSLSAKAGRSGEYRIAVQYFDLREGNAHFTLLVNGAPIAAWTADDTLPPASNDLKLDGHTSTRYTTMPVLLHPGDTITLRGMPDGKDPAAIDYLSFLPAGKQATDTASATTMR